jgi:hypothetical protein
MLWQISSQPCSSIPTSTSIALDIPGQKVGFSNSRAFWIFYPVELVTAYSETTFSSISSAIAVSLAVLEVRARAARQGHGHAARQEDQSGCAGRGQRQ